MIEDLSGVAVDVRIRQRVLLSLDARRGGPDRHGDHAIRARPRTLIAAQREALTRGVKTIAISNVPDTTIVREAGAALISGAGPELSVPATKSFTTQLTILYLMALFLARKRGRMTSEVDSLLLAAIDAASRGHRRISQPGTAWPKSSAACISKRKSSSTLAAACTTLSPAKARSSSKRFPTPMPKDIPPGTQAWSQRTGGREAPCRCAGDLRSPRSRFRVALPKDAGGDEGSPIASRTTGRGCDRRGLRNLPPLLSTCFMYPRLRSCCCPSSKLSRYSCSPITSQ